MMSPHESEVLRQTEVYLLGSMMVSEKGIQYYITYFVYEVADGMDYQMNASQFGKNVSNDFCYRNE